MGLRGINENEGRASETEKIAIAAATSVIEGSKKSKGQK